MQKTITSARAAPVSRFSHLNKLFMALESGLYALALLIIWQPEFNRVFALVLLIPPLVARLVVLRWPLFPGGRSLVALLILLLALAALNIAAAPYDWGMLMLGQPWVNWWVDYDVIVLARPLLGVLLALTVADWLRRDRSALGLWPSLLLSAVIALAALFGSTWSEKSAQFAPLLAALPRLDRAVFAANVNEVGGALAWLAPLVIGCAVIGPARLRVAAWAVFAVLLTALLLGQSRLAIVGVIAALIVIVRLALPPGRVRWVGWGGVAALVIVQLVIQSNILGSNTAAMMLERDEGSFIGRVLIYQSAYSVLLEQPVTGAGLNAFRAPIVRERFYVPGWDQRVLPHAHNEWLQIGTDLGVPGMVWLALVYGTAAYWLVLAYRRGSPAERVWAVAVGGGLLAHGIYGLGDTIALWDRFAFVRWWLIGLAAGLAARVLPLRPVVHL